MHVIEIESGRVGYRDVLDHVVRHGVKSTPRGLPTRDAGLTTIILRTPSDALPVGVGRKVSLQVACAETLQLIGAFTDPRLLPAQFDPFKEVDGSFYGAYGTRVGVQLHNVPRKLASDRDTRQAVVTLWDPHLDNDPGHRDYPCTVALFYRILRDRLWATTVMRSQDLWRGTPYDLWQFTQLQLTLARALGVGVGTYTHITMSTHLYESDLEKVDQVHAGKWYESKLWVPDGIGTPGQSWKEIERRARELPYLDHKPTNLTLDEVWYREKLADLVRLDAPKELL